MSRSLPQESLLQDFADAFNALPIAACRILPDRDGLIVMANTQMDRLFGQDTSARAIGHRLKDLCPRDNASKRLIDKCLKLGVVRGYECALVTDSEELCTFAVTGVAHKNANDVTVIDLLLEPVTERREAFNPLLETPFHLTQAQRIGGLWTWTIDHQTNQLLWSKGIFELLGIDPNTAVPSFEEFYETIHPEDREYVQTTFQNSLQQQVPYESTYRVVRPDGSLRYIKARSEATFGPKGEPVRSIGVVQDVTDQEVSRLQSEQESSRLIDLLEATKTATWEWNVQTGETRFNERWAEIIGYTLDELSPVDISTWLDACHPEDLERSEQALKSYFNGDIDFYNVETRMRHKNGSWVWVLDRGRVVEHDQKGQPLWMYGTHQDITDQKKAQELETSILSRLQKLTSQVPGAVYQFQQWPDGRLAIPYASGGIFDVYGIKPEDVINDAMVAFSQIHPDDLNKVLESIAHSFHALELWHCEHRAIPDGKTTIWLEGLAQPEKQDDGSVLWNGYIRDVTERKENDARLIEASTVFRHADEGIFITDIEGTILDVNTAFSTISGFGRKEAVGKNPRVLKSGRHNRSFYEQMFGALQRHGKWSGEVWNCRSNGELFATRQTISVIHDEFGKPSRYLSLFSDITELKNNQERLQDLAEKDPLTGLPNRLEISRQIDAAMNRARLSQTSLAVAYIDLDGFKEINDRHGHSTGDRVLKVVGDRLSQSFRDRDLLGRIGGDEFVAIMEHVSIGEHIQQVMRRVLSTVAHEIRLGKEKHQLSASIGLTWFNPDAGLDGDQLIRQADQAMYQAKQAGRNCYRVFDLAQDSQVRYLNQRIVEVRRGLENDEFCLFYQPKVNMQTGKIIGVEALIRWQHPEEGFLAPGQFLPELEGLDVMKALSLWVLNTAADQLSIWKKAGHTIPISVNMDGYSLLQVDFIEDLDQCLAAHPHVATNDLEIEVVETSALQDISRVQRVIQECAVRGVRFSIDDFGTGYSSLTYLKRLKADLLKIDASFVRDMLVDPDDLSILRGVLSMADSFGRDCIAEGVETIQHGLLLLACGCKLAQGYAIARPMPAVEVISWTQQWSLPEAWRSYNDQSSVEHKGLFAFVQHNAWVAQLRQFLGNPNQGPAPADESHCMFAGWIRECKNAEDDKPMVSDALIQSHSQLHQLADSLVRSLREDPEFDPTEGLERIDHLHREVVSRLEGVLKIKLQEA